MCGGKWISEIDLKLKNKKIGAKKCIRWHLGRVEMPPRSIQTKSFFRKKVAF